MKKAWAAGISLFVVMLCVSTASAQYKSTVEPRPTVTESLLRNDDGGLLFGWFDPGKFDMHHSFSLSYMTGGGQGMSLGTYTNSMAYRFSDKLDVRADISLMTSPYNSFGKDAQSSLNGLFLNRAELNYRPWKNTLLQISFHQYPANSFMGYGYGSPYGYGYGLGGSFFNSTVGAQEDNR